MRSTQGAPTPWKRRSRQQFPRCAGQSAAQVVVRVGVASREARAAQLEDGRNARGRQGNAQQLFGDPQVGDAEVGFGEALRDAQAMKPELVDGGGGGGSETAVKRERIGSVAGGVAGCGGIEQQAGAVRGGCLAGMKQFDPRGEPVGQTAMRFLIGEASEPAQMAPISAGRIAPIEARQLPCGGGGQSRIQCRGADSHPGLEMPRTGLQHNARWMAMSAHGVDGVGVAFIQIEEEVAGVAIAGVGMEVDVEAVAIAGAQESQGGRLGKDGGGPEALAWTGPGGCRMNEADQVQLVGHGRQLPADGLQSDEKSVIDHGNQCAAEAARRTMNMQRTVKSVLTVCLTSGGKSSGPLPVLAPS